ncbi:flap endonuclease GEN homolog 1 isoform X1 [Anguilla anguilla]|uniref:flap endonuclease GEN homolog 1 isoform X1 n=1 Tax=Anguilla anguilla TaxID=7936 RepID=UPI0015B304EC|nr:flap endonuclease GEN homolog 1 isoform X1 [Anguilla anguilla]
MGVNELWSILEPARESVPLYHLSGKTLAVDLSLWVCEAQFVKEMVGRVAKPHLRNLFFRVSSLMQMGIKLIFVMEGEAPKMKAETMCKRNQLRFGPSKKTASKKPRTGRSYFKAVLKECAEMLDCLGIPWVSAAGEAEAMCAYLDSLGLVDGCITNDGDSFLYGAQTVYRNFNMSTKDPQVDCYLMAKIKSELHLTRETLVGLAILLGCDYLPKGIPGVGKEQALKLIKTLRGQTLLQKFTQWQSEGQDMQNLVVKKVTHCLVCHHPGSAKTHERSGCALCGSRQFCQPSDYGHSCPCDWHQTEQARLASSTEANIKRKTLASEGFPFKEVMIIDEFLVSKDQPIQNVTRRKPNLLLMQNFALDKMEWPKSYTSEKVLVLMTYTEMMNRKCGRGNTIQIQPIRIFKPRVRNGISSFEVIWNKPDHYVYADNHLTEWKDTVRTVEEEALFRAAYPDLVDRFLEEREQAEKSKLKQKKRNKKEDKESNTGPDDVSDLFSKLNIHGSSTGKVEASGTDTVAMADHRNAQELLNCPQSSDQQRNVSEKHDLTAPQGICMKEVEPSPSPISSEKMPATVSSPSVSAVIDELHLSDIDWDGMSFSSAQSPQVQTERPLPPTTIDLLTPVKGPRGTAEKECSAPETGDSAGLELSVWQAARAPESQATVNLSKIPLRERVLARNTIMSSGTRTDIVTAQTNQSTNTPECTAFRPVLASSEDSDIGTHLGEQEFTFKKTLTSNSKNFPRVQHSRHPMIKTVKTQKSTGSVSTKPLSQHNFVKISGDHTALPQRSRSDPSVGAGHKSRTQAVKKSVCISVCSSSENSDAENRPVREQKRTVKSKARKQCPYRFDYSLKPTKVTVLPGSNTVDREPQALWSDQGKSGCAPTIERNWEAADDGEVFIENSSHEVNMNKGDDSVISVDSPLPLAERLKLKFK